MALTTVAELRSTLGVGTLYQDSVLESVCDAADAVLLPMLWTNTTYNIAHSNTATTGTLYLVQPFGVVTADTYVDWTLDQAVQNAALMIAVEIWQARTATLSGSNAVDFQPSPYRMSAQLLAKVRGLISHALAPTSMVG